MIQLQRLSCTKRMQSCAYPQFGFFYICKNALCITLALLLACDVVSPCWARRRSLPRLLAVKPVN